MTTPRMSLKLLLVTSHRQSLEALNAILAKMEPITTFKLDILRPGVYFCAQPLRRTIQLALGGQVVRGIYAGSATKCVGQRIGHHCKQPYRDSDKQAGIPNYTYTKSFPIGFWGIPKDVTPVFWFDQHRGLTNLKNPRNVVTKSSSQKVTAILNPSSGPFYFLFFVNLFYCLKIVKVQFMGAFVLRQEEEEEEG